MQRLGPGRLNQWVGLAIVLAAAVAMIGAGGARQAAAQNPLEILEQIKQKAAEKAKLKDKLKDKKSKTTAVPGQKGAIPGKGGDQKTKLGKSVPGDGADPKRGIGKRGPDNQGREIAKGGDPTDRQGGLGKRGDSPDRRGVAKGGNATDKQGGLSKGKTDKQGGLAKGGNATDKQGGRGDAKGVASRGNERQGAAGKAGIGKADSKSGAGRQITGNGRGGNAGTSAIRRANLGATVRDRQQFRTSHRQQIFALRRRLPARPLPGQVGFTGVPPAGESRFVSTEMVFQVGPNVSRQTVETAARRHGMTIIAAQPIGLTGGTLYYCRVPGGVQVVAAVRAMEGERLGVAQPNYTYRLFEDAARDETAPPEQYVVAKLNLEEVHRVATGNDVLVAVIDSGIDGAHPDIAGTIVDQFDAVGRPEAPHAHGTGMAGAIASHARLLGIAPQVKILAVRAFSTSTRQSPEATTRNILAGLEWAIGKGARVINMSFAGPHDPMLAVAMKNAHAKGVILIAAAGNLGAKSPPLYPAADANVIAVTATDENDNLFSGAVRGPHLAVAAPGVDVMVPGPNETYQLTTGTSVAAAHVSGVAALLLERHPTANATTIFEVLTATAKNLGPNGRDDQFGWGLIDPAAAIAELDERMADNKVASAAPSGATTGRTPAPRAKPAPGQASAR